VSPEDFIFGDIDGVLVVPKVVTLAVLLECERLIGIEDVAASTSSGVTIPSRCSSGTSGSSLRAPMVALQ